MKYKIVMEAQMKGKEMRRKTLLSVAGEAGVEYVGIEGEYKGKVVIIGDEVDAIKLSSKLRKKVVHADVSSISELKSN